MKPANLLLPVAVAVILFAIFGCLVGPALGFTASAGTGWGCLCGLVAGILFAVLANSGKRS